MSDDATAPSARDRLAAKKRASKPGLSRGKAWAFRAVAAVVLPLLFVGVLEIGLRAVGAGWPTSFLVVDAERGFLRNNPKFTWLFFPPEIARQPQEIRIDEKKEPGTIRVFVLGESAAMGDPNPTFGICRMIEAMLEHDFPARRFEVVNTGVTAINSHVVRVIAQECAEHEPDLFVAYIGNNEVLGPFGPGTVLTPAMESLAAIRLQSALKRTKLGQVIGQAARRLASGEKKVWLGLELFTRNQLSARDPGVERVRRHFRANMADIAEIAKDAGAPIIFCTVAVNLENCAPFASLHDGAVDKAAFDAAMAAGADAAGRSWARAEPAFRKAVELSPRHAAALYWLGRSAGANGKGAEAAELLAQARDEDALRFRTERPLNAITREVAAEAGAPLVDLEKVCADASAGAPGLDLFYEHVHMNFRGNFVMADALMPAIRAELKRRFADLPEAVSPPMTEDDMRRRLAFTPMAESGTIRKVLGRIARAPFVGQSDHDEVVAMLRARVAALPTPDQAGLEALLAETDRWLQERPRDWRLAISKSELLFRLERYAEGAVLLEKLIADMPEYALGHYNYAVLLSGQGRDEEAAASFRRAIALDVDREDVRYSLGQVLARMGKMDEARAAYAEQDALTGKSAPALAQLAAIVRKAGRPAEALPFAEEAFGLMPKNNDVREELAATLRALGREADAAKLAPAAPELPRDPAARGQALLSMRRYAEAEGALREALAGNPGHPQLLTDLGIALASQKKYEEALVPMRAATEAAPNSPEVHNNLGATLMSLGRIDEAIACYRRALEIAPDYADAKRNLDRALQKRAAAP